MKYDFEIQKIINEINKSKAKKVCIQLPDGLKPYATQISTEIKSKTNAEIFIWMSTNFGACDTPFFLKDYNFDIVFNFGHSAI